MAESICVLNFKMIKSGAVNDELASNVYVEVQGMVGLDRQRPRLTMERTGKRDLILRS